MKKPVQLLVGFPLLTCLLLAALLPVIADPAPCVQFAKNDACGFAGCTLTIYVCQGVNCANADQTSLITNTFTCVTAPGVNSTCDVVTDVAGNPVYTNCVKFVPCHFDTTMWDCVTGGTIRYCVAPYYMTTNC